MGRGIEGLEEAYGIFFTGALIVLAILVVLCNKITAIDLILIRLIE